MFFHEEKTRVTTKAYQKQNNPCKNNNIWIKQSSQCWKKISILNQDTDLYHFTNYEIIFHILLIWCCEVNN